MTAAIPGGAIMLSPTQAIEALERRHHTIASLSRLAGRAEADVVLDVANQYWSWGEAERALPFLEHQLGRAGNATLQMAHLRCLISLADENRAAVKAAVEDLQSILRGRVAGQATLAAPEVDPRSDRKLRLGFLCTYSNLKPVEFSLVPMLRAIDRSRFHTSFFSLNQEGHPLLNEVCDEHVVLIGRSPREACEAIRRRRVDLLFDLNGVLREDFPVEIFGLRGAPVQAGWWNTPISCGLDSVQYYFMDRSILHPDNDELFTETIVEIPGRATLCYELSDRHVVAPAPCLTSDSFTFGSFTALFKINDVVLDSWAQILARAPGTGLYIKANGATSERFLRRLGLHMSRHGVDWARIFCEPDEAFDVMMGRYAAVDLCLNTYNYGNGTTALNAIWQGVPTLTFAGNLQYARGTASMMVDCGLEDFVVADREAYIAEAIRVSRRPTRLVEVRPVLREHVRRHSTWLCPERFVRNFEQACLNAWADWRSRSVASVNGAGKHPVRSAGVTMVPYVDLKAQLARIRPEIDAAIAAVLDAGQFVLGDEVASFEREFASYVGAAHGIAVNSGTSALHLALLALDVGPGDEVITVPHTFVATAAAILYTGARAVLVDIEPRSFNMDPQRLAAAITSRTRVILPVHLYGQPADMDAILSVAAQHRIPVLEDACQAHGAEYRGRRVGALGQAGAFSFYPGKNLGAYGEGGMAVTNDAALSRKMRMLRDFGQEQKYHHVLAGYNYRMETLQGAILRVKLRHLEAWTQARRDHARRYGELLEGHPGVQTPEEMSYARHVYHVYAVRAPDRDQLRARLEAAGVQTGVHYPVPIHLQPGYASLGYGAGAFPHAERAAREVLSLPMFAELTAEQVETAAGAIRERHDNR